MEEEEHPLSNAANRHPNYPNYLYPPPHLLIPRPQFPPQPLHHPLNPTPTPPSKKLKTTSPPSITSPLETPRRRGRPVGVKNKPKPKPQPESQPTFSPYILEIPSGSDLINSLARFTHRRNLSLCVLSATGSVENVTLKQARDAENLSFLGMFDIISISACLIPGNAVFSGFTVLLAGPRGQIVGGKVVGPLICAGTVYVVGTPFNNPDFTWLPIEDNTGGSGGGGCEGLCTPTPLTVRSPQPPC